VRPPPAGELRLLADERRDGRAGEGCAEAPPLTVTAVPEVSLALADVTQGVHDAGAVPPAIEIGTVTDPVLLLIATTTRVPSEPL
jgi:hypothetical protein